MSKQDLRLAYSKHFLRAQRQGFIPMTFYRFVVVLSHAKAGLTVR